MLKSRSSSLAVDTYLQRGSAGGGGGGGGSQMGKMLGTLLYPFFISLHLIDFFLIPHRSSQIRNNSRR